MTVEVYKTDIFRIGHTLYPEDGNLSIIMPLETHHLEVFFLRNILKCFGPEYKIMSEDDWWRDSGTWDGTQDLANVTDIRVRTNLPYELTQEIYDDFINSTHTSED